MCNSVVGIPVRLLKCKNRCQKVYCLHCVRNHYGMGDKQKTTIWPCVNCNTPLRVHTNYSGFLPARHMYQIDNDEAKRLDKLHGRIRCLRCNELYWRSDYQTHSNNCSKIKKFCCYCQGSYYGTQEEHAMHCPVACKVCRTWHMEFSLCPKELHSCKRCGEIYMEEDRERHPCNIFDKLNPIQKIVVRQWLKCLCATKQTSNTAVNFKDVVPLDVILMVVQKLTTMNYWTMEDMCIHGGNGRAGWYRWYDHVDQKYMVCCYFANDKGIGYDQCQHVDVNYDGQVDKDQLDLYKQANNIPDNEPDTYLLAGYMISRIRRTVRGFLQRNDAGPSAYKTVPPYKDIREAIRRHGFMKCDLSSLLTYADHASTSERRPESYCKVYSGGLTQVKMVRNVVRDAHYTHNDEVLTTLDSPTVTQESLGTILKLYMYATCRFMLRTSWYDKLVEVSAKPEIREQWEMYRLLKEGKARATGIMSDDMREWYINYMEQGTQ